MVTIPIEAEVSTEQLLRAVAQLPPQEFTAFVTHLLALRAQREGPHLSQVETVLLLQINESIAADARRRFEELVAKRQAETISSGELTELIGLTDDIERRDGQRLAALEALARLRRTLLVALMDSLGISTPAYA